MFLHSSFSSGDCENRLVLSLLFWTLSIATHPRFTIPRIRNSDVPGFLMSRLIVFLALSLSRALSLDLLLKSLYSSLVSASCTFASFVHLSQP